MHIRRLVAIWVFGLVVSGSFNPGPIAQAVAEEEEGHDENGEEHEVVSLRPESIRIAGIEIAPVEERAFAQRIEATGEVTFNADRTAHVGPRVEGRIVKIFGLLGDPVESGQNLLILDSVELGQAKAEFRKARARMTLAKKTYEREKRLFAEQISSEREMLETQTTYEEAKIEFEATEETLHILGLPQEDIDRVQSLHETNGTTLLPVVAPFAGTIVEKHATLGEVVDPSISLYTIADLSTLWVETHIYEKDLRSVRVGSPATVGVVAYPGEPFAGTVTYLSDLLDEKTRTVKARVEVGNRDRKLRPGMFTEVRVGAGGQVQVLAVPEEAVQSEDDKWIVFVTEDGERFSEREVQLGDRQDGYVAVLEGLEAGERIVVKGAFFIKSEAAKEGFEAGHAH